jgi:DNA-directed RNA polymerase beta subunit
VLCLSQVYTLSISDKAKTGKAMHVSRKDIMKESKQLSIGMLPVMVKSNLCWLHKLQESECQFDSGGYFLIKGTEKVLPSSQKMLSYRFQ